MKLTSREKEIIEALQKEPLISQEDLAAHFGISRSSIAVHISNLMKKGIILGKGYVFNKKVSIVVIGQVYMEISARQEADRAVINLRNTGFGEEISRALNSFGVNPKLLTVIGNDEWGSQILNELKALDVDLANIYRHPQKKTCKKIVIDQGPVLVDGFTPQDFQQAIDAREWIALNCDWLIVEPVFQEYVTTKVTGRADQTPNLCGAWYNPTEIPPFFKRLQLLVIGVPGFDAFEAQILKAQELVQAGTENCVITDGNSNIVVVNPKGISDFPLLPNQNFDSQAGLNFFLAGLVYGLSGGYPLRQAIRIASGSAHTAGQTSDPRLEAQGGISN